MPADTPLGVAFSARSAGDPGRVAARCVPARREGAQMSAGTPVSVAFRAPSRPTVLSYRGGAGDALGPADGDAGG